jgi:hypothetical protein
MSKRVPKKLLAQIIAIVPPDAEVVPLDFHYEDEDYNIAVFVSETTDLTALQDVLYDLIFNYDDTHGTNSLCYVWLDSERPYIVAGSKAAPS